MVGIHPEGDAIRQAVKWISGCLEENEKTSLGTLIQNAAHRFNLSPKDEEFLISFFKERKKHL